MTYPRNPDEGQQPQGQNQPPPVPWGLPQGQAPYGEQPQPQPPQPQWQPAQPSVQPVQPPRKRWVRRHPVWSAVIAVFVVGGVISAAASGNKGNGNPSSGATSPAAPAATSSAPAPSSAPAAPQYTVSQQQAITAAGQYLAMGSGFSREGLIQQLDSSAGSGFSVADAMFAVNHIKVNWDQQAALAAKGYMQLGGFSYSSMVQQLESSAGSGFTYAQAVHGAKSVGL